MSAPQKPTDPTKASASAVMVDGLHREFQHFSNHVPVTWATLLSLVCNNSSEEPLGAVDVRAELKARAEAYCNDKARAPEEQRKTWAKYKSGVASVIDSIEAPTENLHRPVSVGPRPTEQFSRVFKRMALWQTDGDTFGLGLEKKTGTLVLTSHTWVNENPDNRQIEIVVRQTGLAQQREPRVGQLESLKAFRKVIEAGVGRDSWRSNETDAAIRKQMLYVDHQTSGSRLGYSALAGNPSVRDEPVMTLVRRMHEWPQCLRFLHSRGTLIGYVSGAPVADELSFKSRDPKQHDLNLLRQDVWWPDDFDPAPKSFWFSSVRLLEDDTSRPNRRSLMDGVEDVLCAMAKEDLLFERIYVAAHQRHVQAACRDMVQGTSHAAVDEEAISAGLPLLQEGIIRLHLRPWCIGDKWLNKLRAVYHERG